MRDKFSELIAQGVARFDYKPIAPEITEQDFVCRTYNNIFSIATDTHMHLDGETGMRYITGKLVSIKEKFESFLYATQWMGVDFRHSGYWAACQFLQMNGLSGRYGSLNGDIVYEVAPIPADPALGVPVMPGTYTTSESKIPNTVARLTVDGNAIRIKECYNGKNNLYEVCAALNESVYVLGNEWTVNGDKLMCPFGNKVVIL